MNPVSGVAVGQLMQFPWGNGTVLPPGVGGTSRREEFCSCCQQGTQIDGFSVFLFYFAVLLIIQKTKSSCQQGRWQLPFPILPISWFLLTRQSGSVWGEGVKNIFVEFHLDNQLMLRLAATSPVTLRCRPTVPSSPTLAAGEGVLALEKPFSSVEMEQGLCLVLPCPNTCSGKTPQMKLVLHLEKCFAGDERKERQGRIWWGARLVTQAISQLQSHSCSVLPFGIIWF